MASVCWQPYHGLRRHLHHCPHSFQCKNKNSMDMMSGCNRHKRFWSPIFTYLLLICCLKLQWPVHFFTASSNATHKKRQKQALQALIKKSNNSTILYILLCLFFGSFLGSDTFKKRFLAIHLCQQGNHFLHKVGSTAHWKICSTVRELQINHHMTAATQPLITAPQVGVHTHIFPACYSDIMEAFALV